MVEEDLRGAVLRHVDLTGPRMRGVFLEDVEITGAVRNLVVDGVDVGPLVEAERDLDALAARAGEDA